MPGFAAEMTEKNEIIPDVNSQKIKTAAG